MYVLYKSCFFVSRVFLFESMVVSIRRSIVTFVEDEVQLQLVLVEIH
jgi:hypothetical protein